jgi:hypothetical protein
VNLARTPCIWHCHKTRYRHPSFFNALWLNRSRFLFTSIFFIQKLAFDFGMVIRLQARCPCQKHPLTKTTLWRLGNEKSGVPGKLLSFALYLNLRARNIEATIRSSVVFLDRIFRIISERFFCVKTSAIMFAQMIQNVFRLDFAKFWR